MPYGRRYGRRRPRRRRNTRRRSKSRRHTTGFKTSSRFKAKTARGRKAVRRAGSIACPVVYECLKKIADHNIVYSIKDCEGTITTTADLFGTAVPNLQDQGPFQGATGEEVDRCGFLSPGQIYMDVATIFSHAGLANSDMTPAGLSNWAKMSLDYHAFPLIAKTNPEAIAEKNGGNCRDSSSCMINYFDNIHTLAIVWPVVNDSNDNIYTHILHQRLIMHEVVYFVPDLATITAHALVVPSGTANVAALQVLLRRSRSWLNQMYNAKFCSHPIADAILRGLDPADLGAGSDVIDVTTGAPTQAFDTFNEPLGPTVRIQNNNIKPRFKDTKQFLAAGVLDRRKDARVVWSKRRSFRRPGLKFGVFGSARSGGTTSTGTWVTPIRDNVDEAAVDAFTNPIVTSTPTATETLINLPPVVQKVKCGKRFNIDKTMMWEEVTTADGAIDDTVREVCPRGVYIYAKYWFYDPGLMDSSTLSNALTPIIRAAFTGGVDKTMILKFQNI